MEAKTELQKIALNESRRQELDIFQRALDMQWLNGRMEDGRMGRCLALIQREADMEKDFQERTDHAALVNAKAAKETNLGIEIAKVRREEVCHLLRRHYLRERDPELRELIRKLQAGYTCRDLIQQIKHNEYRKLQEKATENYANNILKNSLYDDFEQQKKGDQEKMQKTTQYRQELQQQLVNRHQQKMCQYEDTLIEKKMLDDIMRTISDEDHKELQQKQEAVERTRRDMVTFKQAQEAWKEKQKQMVVLEERDIERQKKMVADRNSAILEARAEKLRIKDEINDKVCSKILADEEKIRERADLIKLLQEQEALEKTFQDEVKEKEKLERVKHETRTALTAQMDNRKRLEEEQRRREREFRKHTTSAIAAEEEKEREKQRQLKEKNKTYAHGLMLQIQDNERRRKTDAEIEERRIQSINQYYKKWDEEVDSERKNVIRDHVPPLIGYLQAGVIQKKDLPTVKEGANSNKHLSKLDIEALAVSNRPKIFTKCNPQCMKIRRY